MRTHVAALNLVFMALSARAAAGGVQARPPPPPPTPIVVRAEGSIVTGAVRAGVRHRYQLTPPAKGTTLISIQPIHGSSPRALLKLADGRILRRERNGQIWTRAPAGEELILEISPRAADQPGVYLVRVVFDIDRPRPERDRPRPARPGDTLIVSKRGQAVERVLVDGIVAEFKDRGPDALVTIPAFARSGEIELYRESGRPERTLVELIGAEPARPDLTGDACNADGGVLPGCLQVTLSPAVGSAWLQEIARVVDADLVAHEQKAGIAVLRLRLASTENFALTTLRAMPGIRAAQR